MVTSTADSGAGSLRAAIISAASGDTIQFQVGGTITLQSELPVITKNIAIDGNGNNPTISGAGTYRPFFIGDAGTTGSTYSVTLKNLTIANAVAQGGAGLGSGAGAGLGGAAFVSSNGALTLSNVAVSNTQAKGGSVVDNIGEMSGGGGMGGKSYPLTPTGGGGLFVGSDAPGTGNGGGPNGGVGNNVANGPATGGAGGFASGGGGASSNGGPVVGGAGGFGGGGGGANAGGATTGGSGGYGGGGGSANGTSTSVGGVGGFGGGGGSGMTAAGVGGFGAGNGVSGYNAGGGGLGAGGAIFVQSGGSVTVQGDLSQTAGSASGGAGYNGGTNGSAFGSGIFFQGTSGTASILDFGSGTQSIANGIADYTGSGGTNPGGGTNVADQGGSVAITKSNGGTLTLSSANTYSGGTTINEGSTLVVGNAQALGTGTLTLNGGATGVTVTFNGSYTIANNIAATGDPIYNVITGSTVNLTGVLSGSGDVVVNEAGGYAGTLILSGVNTYTGPTTVDAGTLQAGSTSAFGNNSSVTVASGALLDLAGFSNAIGSLAGAGTVTNSGGAATLTAGGDTTSTVFSGTIQDGAGSIALTKAGTGLLLLSGSNTYSGATIVSGGTLQVDGSIASSSLTTVQSGAALSGSGTVGSAVIENGAIFAPGNGNAGTAMTVSGNLAFHSGAVYLVQVTPSAASFAAVTGTATLGGATVDAVFASGSYISRRYTILTASGGVNGTFGSLVTAGLPGNIRSVGLSYDTNDVYLDLALNFAIPSDLNGNQQRVGNALTNFFNANGGIAAVYGTLTPAGLTQVSGEPGTGSQQTSFNAMSQFVGLLTDPISQRDGGPGAASGAAGFAEEDRASAYAARRRTDAFAMVTKAPPQAFAPRWSVWAAGFGGSQSTMGNAATGSNDSTSHVFGTAAGADYRFSADTLAGFALAGGGTNFSVANGLGSGRSDLFQVGAYLRHTNGPAYISAALAYGWQNITTDRTVTIAGADRLRAAFDANAYSGRLEGGYRFVAPWIGGIGLTPYAAAQFTTFDLPAYAEQVVSGSSAFALSYAARSVTDTRSELGLRSDKSFAVQNGVLTLRGRAAWAHDFNPDRSIVATFQALPGASLVVNGAAQARDSALTSASLEMKWLNGWSAAATFEGEFSNVTRSYAGKGSVRYAW
ncbi:MULTISPECIES: autotransporter domain-containing protein [unclassified Bradyrhizobium]|uniref:autotransporter domain-containing protein n=1 Tax=unclassified Bradyrhizobium TaxID=2631580 RepID=UPI0020B4615A|nr:MULTISPECIES: autotransporter domain-containing protein [unclassified Bradyrhizobium]MCP3386629.1 autotransporter domain-containing protein [Bradyrhizobium sp. CCGUVB4N]MCP3447846.1 autotransporter domain-containing protein [Bradyrhizobium sp. CCGUVB14]